VVTAVAAGCTSNNTPSTPTPTPSSSATISPDTLWVQDATTRTVRSYKGASTANGGAIPNVVLPTSDTANPDIDYDPVSDTLWYPNQTVPNAGNSPGSIDIWTMATTKNNMLPSVVISSLANTSNLEGAAVFTGPAGLAPNLLLVAHNTSNVIDVYSNAIGMTSASVPAGHITLTMTDGTIGGTPRPQELFYDPVRDILFVADNGSVCAKFGTFSTAANAAAGGGSPVISSTSQITGLGLGNGAGIAYNTVKDILFIVEVSPPQIDIEKNASSSNGGTTHSQTLTNFVQPKGLAYESVHGDNLFVYDADIFVFPNATTASGNQLAWPGRKVIFDLTTALSGFGIFVDPIH
jgi:hypothetical protein